MKHTFSAAAALIATFSLAAAQSAPKCGPGNNCPSSAPCCSQYGQCGAGAYCLGGCDPEHSFSLQSCMAAPTCKSQDYKFNNLDDIAKNTEYLGDASKANWVSSGTAVAYNGDSVLLTMAPSTVGTLLSSTHYVWYGKISATLTTSQGQGVVTAFILMSDVKDEIDFEWVGDNVESTQTNYYYQGITNYENMKAIPVSDTRQNVHTYEIDWTPDSITWSIDGKSVRTMNKKDTYNSTTKGYNYPQTPARVQLSLWPAGLASNGEGTIEWAGGLVNWDSNYMQNGYYYAMVSDVTVECYDPPSTAGGSGDAYYYTSVAGTEDTVKMGNNNTILGSFQATGDNPDVGSSKASGTSSSKGAASPTAQVETVPGISGGGNVASSGEAPVANSGDSGSGSSSSSGSTSSSSSNGGSSFSQGMSSDGTNTSEAPKLAAGSVVALLGFFVAALTL